MYDWSKEMTDCIINKKEISKNNLMAIERALRLSEIHEEMLDYQVGLLDENNTYELTMKC